MAIVTGTQKAALSHLLIADYKEIGQLKKSDFYPLDQGITEVSDDTDVDTDSQADYAGDGNAVETVQSVTEKYKYEGDFYYGDPAHELVRAKKGKVGNNILAWIIRVEPDGAYKFAKANVIAGAIGGGEASDNAGIEVTFSLFPGYEEGKTEGLKTRDNLRPDVFEGMSRTSGGDFSSKMSQGA